MMKSALIFTVLLSVTAFAGQPTLKAQYDFPNPNGCIAYENIITSCTLDVAEHNCVAVQALVDQVGKQIPALQLKSSCYAPDITGLLEWSLIQSSAYKGYRLSLKVKPPGNVKAFANVASSDPVACNAATIVLKGLAIGDSLKVDASCNGSGLTAAFQY